MSTYSVVVENGSVQVHGIENTWTIPCVWMRDVTCESGSITISVEDGVAYTKFGDEIKIEDGSMLRGWGSLDGDDNLVLTNRVWEATVPRKVLDKIAEWTGLVLPVNGV